jgi:RNA polymerase primary sigma factor
VDPPTTRPRAPRRLSPGETAQLVRRAQQGDRQARDRVVSDHMRLVRAVALRYRDLGLPVDDLVQEGAIGLLSAVEAFDPRRGAAFSTFAHLRVRNAVLRALTSNGRPVRLPKTLVERRHALTRADERLLAQGSPRSVEALADETGLSVDEVVEALTAPAATASLDAPVRDGLTLEDLVADPTAVDPEAELLADERHRVVAAALGRLSPRRQAVISRYFGLAGDGANLGEIGAELDISQQRARAIRDDALHDLASALERELPPRHRPRSIYGDPGGVAGTSRSVDSEARSSGGSRHAPAAAFSRT